MADGFNNDLVVSSPSTDMLWRVTNCRIGALQIVVLLLFVIIITCVLCSSLKIPW